MRQASVIFGLLLVAASTYWGCGRGESERTGKTAQLLKTMSVNDGNARRMAAELLTELDRHELQAVLQKLTPQEKRRHPASILMTEELARRFRMTPDAELLNEMILLLTPEDASTSFTTAVGAMREHRSLSISRLRAALWTHRGTAREGVLAALRHLRARPKGICKELLGVIEDSEASRLERGLAHVLLMDIAGDPASAADLVSCVCGYLPTASRANAAKTAVLALWRSRDHSAHAADSCLREFLLRDVNVEESSRRLVVGALGLPPFWNTAWQRLLPQLAKATDDPETRDLALRMSELGHE